MSRRDFIKKAAICGMGAISAGSMVKTLRAAEEKPEDKPKPTVAVAEGDDPAKLTQSVIETLGGMTKFVKKGDVVVVKPNIAWERPPELAANTNPQVVAAIVKECLKAGAKTVKVFDKTCNDCHSTYEITGIAKAAKEAGADVVMIEDREAFFEKVGFKGQPVPNAFGTNRGEPDWSWPIVKEALTCNVFINVPIAKHHGLTKLTLGIKNLMGVMGGRRGQIHQNIDNMLVDVLFAVKPHLTIIDAYRILLRNGPTGGNPKDVMLVKKVLGSTDPVAADSYVCSIFPGNIKGADIGYIKLAFERGFGEIDIAKMNIVEKKV
ncbi:MAG: DUF362 domain-containing protein [Planctomycetes bacterium]|nr:DUF362 domain-containing protein [Planctomycetota bacterium]